VLTGTEATLERFLSLASRYRILHLATHALADFTSGSQAYLAFPASQKLYPGDIGNGLDINADLVVLSACETGIGVWRRGEGMLSLGRAFIFGGAKSVVTSLWQVKDASTADLMRRFYVALRRGQTKDLALSGAQRDCISKGSLNITAHPYYWSGFILTGDPMRLFPARSSRIWSRMSVTC